MTIESLFTQTTRTATAAQPSGQATSALGGAQANVVEFWNLLLGSILETKANGENTAGQAAANGEESLLQSGNPLLDKTPGLNLAELLAANPEIEEQVANFIQPTVGTDGDDVIQTLSLNQQAFDNILKPLAADEISLDEALKKLQNLKISDIFSGDLQNLKIEDLDIQTLNNDASGIIQTVLVKIQTVNPETGAEDTFELVTLNPEQTTQIQNILSENGTDPEDAYNASIIGFLQIVPTQNNGNESKPAQIIALTAKPATEANQNNPATPNLSLNQNAADSDAAALNNLPIGEDGSEETAFDRLMKIAAEKTANGKASQTQTTGIPTAPTTAQANTNAANTSTAPLPPASDMNPAAFDGITWDQTQIAAGATSGSGTQSPLAAMNASTSLTTHSNSAAQPHPGTQMVAATLQQAGANGTNRSITLQLDPPDLGKVEVQMNFGKDKTVKALITVEKPETYSMLQRDAQTLERAMQDAGLNAEGGISFELAGDDHRFGQDGGHDGSRNQAGQGENDNDTIELIESTMTWQVDPETGYMRYDILV